MRPLKKRSVTVLGVVLLGALTPLLAGPKPADDAVIVSADFPATLAAGESANARVTVRNTGTETWTPAKGFKLGAVDDSDPFATTRIYLPDGTSVASGAEFTFTIPLTAPQATGDYRTDWRMVHELVRWFGASTSKTITVTAPQEDGAQVVAFELPTVLDAGQTFDASVTMKNTGTLTWTRDTHKLGAVDDTDPLTGENRIYLPQGTDVAPGDSWTFRFQLRGPGGKGTFKTDWRMVHEGVRWFGGTAERGVTVQSDQVDASTLEKKLVMGYQGWFACEGDGSPVNGWVHWSSGRPATTNMTVDLWPDVSELDADELFDTGLTLRNGGPAKLYSAAKAKTVARHFKWMKDAGVDGVLLQRFSSELRDARFLAQRDLVLQNVRAAAEQHGRIWAVEYDISGNPEGSLVDDLVRDWDHLTKDLKILDSGRYIHHRGKPLIVIWGLGLADRPGTPDQARRLVDHFRGLGLTIMLGVAGGWRDNAGTKNDPAWQGIYHSADIINPWFVGAFANTTDAYSFAQNRMKPDLDDCRAHGIDYMPVVFPGFTWHNLMATRGQASPYNAFPRQGGKFYWAQVANAVGIGCNMIFNAMFDEVDEGTAMMKVAPTQDTSPVSPQFVTLDADGEQLPSDWYLRLAGEASKMLRGEIPLTNTIPISPR